MPSTDSDFVLNKNEYGGSIDLPHSYWQLILRDKSRIPDVSDKGKVGREGVGDGVVRSERYSFPLKPYIDSTDFDVFLCHNSDDKPAVKAIGEQLKGLGLRPWLDEWELRPGLPWLRELEKQIKNIKSAAIFVGPNGIGPWQDRELDALLRQFVKRERPVIPAILPGCEQPPELPLFLGSMTWVDFRRDDPPPLQWLIWGITGKKPY